MSATITIILMKDRVSLKHIALKTGFSIKTVSRALNNHQDVNTHTRKKILKAARDYSYYPNLLAKGLRTNRTYSIGYIVPDITNEFFGRIGIAIERIFKARGYSLLVSFTEEMREREIDSLKLLLSHRVCGIVLATVGTTGDFLHDEVQRYGVPVVVIDNKVESTRMDCVLHDNVNGAYKLTEHLIHHGHRRIASITGPLFETSGKERLRGFENALADHGVPLLPNCIKNADWKMDGGYHAVYAILSGGGEKPTGLFVANSVMALGVLKAASDLGLRVPEDLALVSFDNLSFAEAINPALTTLDSPEEKIAALSSEMLLNRIDGGDTSGTKEFYVEGNLCIRQSCGCR